MRLGEGRGPGGAYLLAEQHLLHVFHLLSPRYHGMIWGLGQEAAPSLSHRLAGAIEAQELKVLQPQILSPIFSALSCGENKVASGQGGF